jgi:molybdate transport system ATP-binding protein
MLEVDIRVQQGGFRLDAAFTGGSGVTALFGRSGAGKTTVLNAIAGLVPVSDGHIRVDGAALFDSAAGIDLPVHRRRVGYVFQDARLFPHMSVARNLTYGARRADPAALGHMAALLDLEHHLKRRPGSLSGGERQRVAIGRAMLADPRLLLMDEPLTALDIARRAEILPYIERLRDEAGIAIVYVSHTVEEVTRLAERVVFLDGGRVAAAGAVDDVMGQPDLMALTGRAAGGAILQGVVAVVESGTGLAAVDTPAGAIWAPDAGFPVGAGVRLRLRARDVSLSARAPEKLSVVNALPATVVALDPGEGPAVTVRLDAGGETVLAQVTRRAVAELDIAPGVEVWALVDAVALDPPVRLSAEAS